MNLEGSYKCSCDVGFSGSCHNCISKCISCEGCLLLSVYYITHYTLYCVDVDECRSGEHICHQYAECIDTHGSYKCQCRDGFTGDGVQLCQGNS